MRAIRTFGVMGALAALAAGASAVSFETACHSVPNEFCNGAQINQKRDPGASEPDLACTQCMEQGCCDFIGDCQKTTCKDEVAAAHACVIDAGRSAGSTEQQCVGASVISPKSKDTYQCMRDKCGETCGFPVCRLDPLVPRVGSLACDHCFAESCCTEMNDCAKNRTCLLVLQCIADKCVADAVQLLRTEAHPAVLSFMQQVCANPPVVPDGGGSPRNCFDQCLADNVAPSAEATEARCLAARVIECGSDVACGESCRVTDAGADASHPADASDAADAADAGDATDAADDG